MQDQALLPKIGDKIKAIRCRYSPQFDGQECVVSDIIHGDPLGIMCDFASGTIKGVAVSEWEPITPEDSPEHQIADLTNQLYDVSKELDRYKSMYVGDMAHWENTMRDVKDRENWCDKGTNKIIGELNQGFTGWQLDYYEQDFEIEVEVRATIVTTTRVMVSATSEEAAYESVLDDPEAYFSPTAELADAAQYVDDYEVDIA